jgi:hypothetical protein
VGSITWGREIAEVYDETHPAGFKPSVLGPMVDLLAGLAHDGPVLEFAAGAGRAALALHARGAFTHVYLAANTIMNVTSKDDQIAVFANAAAHLESRGASRWRRSPRNRAGCPRARPPDVHPRFPSRRDRDLQRPGRDRSPGRITGSKPAGTPLPALPLRLAIQARPHRQDRRLAGTGPVGGLGPGAVHLRKRQLGRGIREAAVRRANGQSPARRSTVTARPEAPAPAAR